MQTEVSQPLTGNSYKTPLRSQSAPRGRRVNAKERLAVSRATAQSVAPCLRTTKPNAWMRRFRSLPDGGLGGAVGWGQGGAPGAAAAALALWTPAGALTGGSDEHQAHPGTHTHTHRATQSSAVNLGKYKTVHSSYELRLLCLINYFSESEYWIAGSRHKIINKNILTNFVRFFLLFFCLPYIHDDCAAQVSNPPICLHLDAITMAHLGNLSRCVSPFFLLVLVFVFVLWAAGSETKIRHKIIKSWEFNTES